jgi:hypothetical protein
LRDKPAKPIGTRDERLVAAIAVAVYVTAER